MHFAAGQRRTACHNGRMSNVSRISACHNQHWGVRKPLAAAKVCIWLPPSPHSVLLVSLFHPFPIALDILVVPRVSNPTTINSG